RLACAPPLPPEEGARFLVQTREPPRPLRVVDDGVDVAVEPDAERLVGLGAHGGRDEDAIAPDDGARMAEAGDVDLPGDVAAGRNVPGRGDALTVAVAGSALTAE